VWDLACELIAESVCGTCCDIAEENQGACGMGHATPGCNAGSCEDAVCEVNPDCCTASWDWDCAYLACGAEGLCGVPCQGGDESNPTCCIAQSTPGCSWIAKSPNLCEPAVCAIDPFCCDVVWDQACVDIAATRISCSCCSEDPTCEAPTGPCDCCEVGTGPGCSFQSCEDAVCAQDPFCCDTLWDAVCAEIIAPAEIDACSCCALHF
jgi:hypothetical protein